MPIKAIVDGAEKEITRIPVLADNTYKDTWEVRDNQDRLLWYREDTLTRISSISYKGYGIPLKSMRVVGNGQKNGTPSPDNIIMPTFCGERTGNLFDKNAQYASESYYLKSDGTETASGGFNVTDYYEVEPNAQYYLQDVNVSSTDPSVCFYDSTRQFISGVKYNRNPSVSITTPQNTAYIKFSVNRSNANLVMLIKGSTALPYEPYGYKIPLTCGGQTVPVYLGQVQTVRRIKKVVLTGKEGWTITSNGVLRIGLSGQLRPSTPLCTHYLGSNSTAWSNVPDKSVTVSISGYLAILDTTYTAAADFKSYLAAQYAAGTPVTVWYVLATPETAIVNEPLCKIGDYADELSSTDAGVTIPTVKGNNTLTVDTPIQPSEMSITYRG